MSNKIPLDSQEFKEKYTSKTDPDYGVIFVPNIPGLPVLNSNGEEIVGYRKSVPENSFQSLASVVFFIVVLYLFYNNGPYENTFINFFWDYLWKLWVWYDGLW